jgi:uncharacterized membrane protein
MESSHLHYLPISIPYAGILAFLLLIVVVIVQLRLAMYAYEKMGINPHYVSLILFLSLIGAAINFPVAQLPAEKVVTQRTVDIFGTTYVVPEVKHWPGTIIAVNLGGAVIPTLLSFYLLIKNRLLWRGLLGIAIVALVTNRLATPVKGVGIAMPGFIPPIIAAAVGLLLGWRSAAPLAYSAGALGTLIGADLMNLGAVRGLGAPVASIGGAGTYDGIFLTGIVAVLLTWSPPPPAPDIPPSPPQESTASAADKPAALPADGRTDPAA